MSMLRIYKDYDIFNDSLYKLYKDSISSEPLFIKKILKFYIWRYYINLEFSIYLFIVVADYTRYKGCY